VRLGVRDHFGGLAAAIAKEPRLSVPSSKERSAESGIDLADEPGAALARAGTH